MTTGYVYDRVREAGILLSATGIRKSFGDRDVLKIDNLKVYDGQRIALIGENGAGKSTLLSLLSGESEPDEGALIRRCRMAYIHQVGQVSRDGDRTMQSLFKAPEQRDSLSGGEMTRRRIAEALSSGAELLLADEPGTDLDREGIALLRQQLNAYPGALILVSHDRSLLEEICSSVWHLEDGKITVFPGKYSDYLKERERRRAFMQFEYDQYRAEKKRLKEAVQQKREWASSVQKAPKRMGNSEARLHTREYTNAVLKQSQGARRLQNRMDHLEKKERPREAPEIVMKLGASNPIRARNAMEITCERMTAGGRTLLEKTGFILPAGSRTALTGLNGTGKTTLLQCLLGKTPAEVRFEGDIRINPSARIGCFDQHHERTLKMDASVLRNVMEDSSAAESDARGVLALLNLRGDMVYKPLRVLSGGERAKVALARVLLSDSNLLILDEPTNHLDIFAMEALQSLLQDYAGTLLFVSHDETLLREAATRIVRIEDRRIVSFEGTLDQMREASRRDESAEAEQMEITRLEMRLAALSARLSAPRKGDRPDLLNQEYAETAAQLSLIRSRAGKNR